MFAYRCRVALRYRILRINNEGWILVGEYHKIASTGDLAPGEVKQHRVEDRPMALCNVEGEFHAFEDTCTHQFACYSEGELSG